MKGQFKKGQSGNPSGRPKVFIEIRDLAREHTAEAVERLVHWMRANNPSASLAAAVALLDRGYGKPVQTLNTHVTRTVVDITDAELADIATTGGDRAPAPQGSPQEPNSVH